MPTQWPNNCRGAVSLSYDDGVPVHFETVAPLLEANGMRATFFVPVRTSLVHYPSEWREVAARGHELGNHTLFHPCYNKAVFPWLEDIYDLVNYTPKRWVDEMTVANFALRMVDGRTERTFGNTCWNNVIGPVDAPEPMEPLMRGLFKAARGTQQDHQPVNLERLNPYDLGSTQIDFYKFEDVRAEIEQVVAAGGWIIYVMHGVGKETHNLHMEAEEHDRLIGWLGERRDEIWSAPVLDVLKRVQGE